MSYLFFLKIGLMKMLPIIYIQESGIVLGWKNFLNSLNNDQEYFDDQNKIINFIKLDIQIRFISRVWMSFCGITT